MKITQNMFLHLQKLALKIGIYFIKNLNKYLLIVFFCVYFIFLIQCIVFKY